MLLESPPQDDRTSNPSLCIRPDLIAWIRTQTGTCRLIVVDVHGPDSTVHLEPDGQGTRLKLSHQIMGPVDDQVRAGYASGWQELLERHFKRFVEEGKSFRDA